MHRKTWGTLAAVSLWALGCGVSSVDVTGGADSSELTDQQIVDGEPATSSQYDAVGAVVAILPDGSVEPFCTGTLVSSNVVVTAKHCALLTPPGLPVGFAIGFDGQHPNRLVQTTGFFWERTVTEGFMGLGSDVAVLILAERVRNISPVKVRSNPQPGTYLAVGYGLQAYEFETPGPIAFGTRQKGLLDLAAVGPAAFWPVVYNGDYDAFLADFSLVFPPEYLPYAEWSWNEERLTPQYDALFRRNTANTNSGDSGGPILQRKNRSWETYGVTSGIGYLSLDTVRNFTIYSSYGPKTVEFVEAAEECGTATREGVCDGRVRRACVPEQEHDGEVEFETRSQLCPATCVQAPTGAHCAPACATDADCGAIAANGTCANGVCTWSALEMCRAEPGDFACFLCCLGQATGGDFEDADFAVCSDTCFGAPAAAATNVRVRFPGFPEIRVPRSTP